MDRILPPPNIEDFYVEIDKKNILDPIEKATSNITRTNLPRMQKLFEWDLLRKGDKIFIKNYGVSESEAEVIDPKTVKFKDSVLKYNAWGQKVTGWSSICIYEWAIKSENGKTLYQLRREKMAELEN